MSRSIRRGLHKASTSGKIIDRAHRSYEYNQKKLQGYVVQSNNFLKSTTTLRSAQHTDRMFYC